MHFLFYFKITKLEIEKELLFHVDSKRENPDSETPKIMLRRKGENKM